MFVRKDEWPEVVFLVLVFVAIIYATSSCATKGYSSVSPEDQSAGMIVPLPWDNQDWDFHMTDFIDSSFLTTVTPSDATSFCPKFKTLTHDQKVEFYAHLLARVAQRESSFNPDATYVECSDKRSTYGNNGVWIEARKKWCLPGSKKEGGVAVSRGLFQLSIDSANAYGCGFVEPQDLHDPEWNMTCAVLIADKWVTRDKVLSGGSSGAWRGLARYWAVMRSSSSSRNIIRNHVKSLPYCN